MSRSKNETFDPLLKDVEELNTAHANLRTGNRGRQWDLAALNRSVIVLTVSAWEAYVEDLVLECVDLLRSPTQPAQPGGSPLAWPHNAWPALNAEVKRVAKQLHTPNPPNVKRLVATATGLADVTLGWSYRRCNNAKAIQKLDELLTLRHQIAHGVHPRPVVHNKYATWAPLFVARIVECTESTLRSHLIGLGIPNPW